MRRRVAVTVAVLLAVAAASVSATPMRWTNRPTFQQVVQFRSHR